MNIGMGPVYSALAGTEVANRALTTGNNNIFENVWWQSVYDMRLWFS